MKEEKRQKAIRRYRILDSESEAMFDDLVALAVYVFNAEFALISLTDENRQWNKSACGTQISEFPRDTSFCTIVVQSEQSLIVENAKLDPRFQDHPNVKAGAQISFYVGAPLITPTGEVIGSLCVAGLNPNTASPAQIEALERLARQVIVLMEARLINLETSELADANSLNAAISQIANQAHSPVSAIELCLKAIQESRFHLNGKFISVNEISADSGQTELAQKRRSLWCCSSHDWAVTGDPTLRQKLLSPVYTSRKWLGLFEFEFAEDSTSELRRIIRHLSAEIAHVLERSIAEETLELQNNFVSAVLDNLTDGIVACNAAGQLTIFNRATREFHGLTEADISSENWASHYSLFKADGITPLQIDEVPLYRTLRGEVLKDAEIVIAPNFSSPRTVLCSGRPLTGKQGENLGAVVAMADITARKGFIAELETAKKHLEQRIEDRTSVLNTVLQSIPLIVWQTDPFGKVHFMNSKWLEYTGTSPEDGIWPRIHPEERDLAYEACVQSLRTGKPYATECRVQAKNGEYRWYFVRAFPSFNDAGKIISWFGTASDINDKKLSDELRIQSQVRETAANEASRLKSEFLAIMSHEIRTPINGVLGMTGLLLDTALTPEQLEFANTISASADSLLLLINDILDFSKVEAGKLELDIIDFDLSELMAEVEKIVGFPAKVKRLKLSHHLDSALKNSRYFSDPTRLRQILTNLMTNAVKFTAVGEVTVRVEPLIDSIGQSFLKFSVADTGIGISALESEKLFKAFSQADASTTRKFGGSGLGLSISKQLVHLLGGEIGVESVVGQGSCFWFTLPAIPAGPVGKWPESEVKVQASLMEMRKLRILLAEDNTVNQTIATKMLQKLGHYVDIAANGLEVLEALNRAPYDLILMDCQMPEMDGYQATESIRMQTGAPFQNIPIIAMTANAMSGDREKCLAVGMTEYVSKPVKAQQLAEKIASVLKPLAQAS